MEAPSKMVRTFYNNECDKNDFKAGINHDKLNARTNSIIEELSKDVMDRYYGCHIIIPEHLEGARIIDLGCGSGSSVFILSKLVGPKGFVLGIDFCQNLIDTAEKDSEYHYKKWGYDKPNFEFRCADVQTVTELGFEEGSFDAVVSNAVFSLCPDQAKVFNQVYRMLKTGGQLLLSDIFCEAELPEEIRHSEDIMCYGMGGLAWYQLSPLCQSQGFTIPYLIQCVGYTNNDEEIKKILNNAEHICSTNRMFKMPPKAKRGAATVTYLGNLEDYPESLPWDIDLTFKKGQPVAVDGQLATILSNTDFAKNFSFDDFSGDVCTNRAQNPFQHLRDLIQKGQAPIPVYERD